MAQVYEFGEDELREMGVLGEEEELRCGFCNWRTSSIFIVADNREEAVKFVREHGTGICGQCLAEWLVDDEVELIVR